MHLNLPAPVAAVFGEFHTCEFATLAKDGTPLAWPTSTLYLPERRRFLITTSIAMPSEPRPLVRDARLTREFSDQRREALLWNLSRARGMGDRI